MHVLLTNDDGPLNDKLCPYMKYLVDEILTSTDWDLSIVVPDQQRSWIGKAHFAGKTLSASYIYTKISTLEPNAAINAYEGPFHRPEPKFHNNAEYQEWCLINSTPAACADIGIHHLYTHTKEKPVDLVISGPNFGKNSSNLYILASGTVGAAMEAVTHGIKAIALSYAFNNLDHDYYILKEAAKISVKLIAKLYKELQRSEEVDLFSVNIPLVDSLDIKTTKISYAPILQNYWKSIYSPLGEPNEKGQLQFSWTPDFKKVYKDGMNDLEHTDSRVLLEEGISVTPLKAAFKVLEPLQGEIKLDDEEEQESEKTFLITIPEESYIYEPLVEPFKKLGYKITSDKSIIEGSSDTPVFHYGEYEDIDIDSISENPNYYIPSYIYRKALIRKHYLANTIHHYVTKNPESVLKQAVPESYQLEVDYAEFLDDALDDAYELREEINQGDKLWILKPSMSDKGQGIRLFKTIDQLQDIFNSFEEGNDEEDENGEHDDNNGIILSQLRHFIVQEYKSSPLLLEDYDNKKFHLRTYVVCLGDLKVFVYKNILTLFAGSPFTLPSSEDDSIPMDGHLTNTCLQEGDNPLVVPFWKLQGVSTESKTQVFNQVCSIVKELFTAATSVDKMNFQPLSNAIEIFGIDFLVNSDLSVTLLEVNSYPDFKQTGDDLKELIYELFERTVVELVDPLVSKKDRVESNDSSLVQVL
ncbi:putative tubulin--tyrosine ligase PBY1 [Candida viswanathii]|uniref:Putative tubulin--tyrosine ligase PBY1 n=1 Tax=Candida viswanathii TaxID=5486 RepID=A0A367Y173_9ASCO|nr:putative tubulin--tyrosine ligase PBY1 [Candida viswanathii]